MKRFLLLLIAIGVWSLLAACQRQPSLTPQEQTTVNALTSNLKTRCVGRYLIDMPADVAIFNWTKVNGVDIEAKAMSLEDYHKAMQAYSKTLNSTQAWHGYRFLYADTVIDGIPESRYFVSLPDRMPLTDAERVIEAYRWDHGYQIKMELRAYSAKDAVAYKDDPEGRADPAMNNLPAKAQLVVSLLSRAHGRADDDIPTDPGVCFQGGFLAGPQWGSEDVDTDFVLSDRHDVSFDLKTDTDVHDETTLLQRGKDINAALAHDPHGKTVRKGDVSLQGMHAEEWLIKGTTDLRVPGFMFSMEANSLPNKENKPVVMLDMGVGAPSPLTGNLRTIDKASLDENESIGLWDAVSRTLRPRPNAF